MHSCGEENWKKLALDETKNPRELGGLNITCVSSKADALFLLQNCRLLSNTNFNSAKHIKFWIGSYLENSLQDMKTGLHAEIVPCAM